MQHDHHDVLQYNTTQCYTAQHTTAHYPAVQQHIMQYDAVEQNTMQCNAMHCNAMQYTATQDDVMQMVMLSMTGSGQCQRECVNKCVWSMPRTDREKPFPDIPINKKTPWERLLQSMRFSETYEDLHF